MNTLKWLKIHFFGSLKRICVRANVTPCWVNGLKLIAQIIITELLWKTWLLFNGLSWLLKGVVN